jgi:hypothetical protein
MTSAYHMGVRPSRVSDDNTRHWLKRRRRCRRAGSWSAHSRAWRRRRGWRGGDVRINAYGAGGINLGPGSLIDVSRGFGGFIHLDAHARDVLVQGDLRANATLRDGDGGYVQIDAYQAPTG